MKPGVDVISTKEKILYSVWTTTVNGALGFCGGLKALPLKDVEWLKVSEQHLLEFTNGVVFRDDLGEFSGGKGEMLPYYPNDVLGIPADGIHGTSSEVICFLLGA